MIPCDYGDALKFKLATTDNEAESVRCMADYDAHRAACPTCRSNEAEALNVHKRLSVGDLTQRPQCPEGCKWETYDGVTYCGRCGNWYTDKIGSVKR